jgi:hypothetical protein
MRVLQQYLRAYLPSMGSFDISNYASRRLCSVEIGFLTGGN